jgi:hypothetical protein
MTHWRAKRRNEDGWLWEVTLVSNGVSANNNRPITKRVKVRAWTGAEAELKAIEPDPNWMAIIKHTKNLEEK